MAAPVICDPASEARNRASAATHSGWTHFSGSAPGIEPRLALVFIVAGRTELAVMSKSLFSKAAVWMRETSAAFEALYALRLAAGTAAWRLAIAIIRPRRA